MLVGVDQTLSETSRNEIIARPRKDARASDDYLRRTKADLVSDIRVSHEGTLGFGHNRKLKGISSDCDVCLSQRYAKSEWSRR